MRKRIIALLAGAMLMMATSAMATSWSQGFNELTATPFNKVEIFMMSIGVHFLPPTGQTGFSDGSWTANLINPNYSIATGTDSTNLTWNINFTDTAPLPISFDFLAYNNNSVVDSASATWNGGGWSIGAATFANGVGYDRTPVPEPSTMMLLGAGIFGLAIYGKRRMNKEA